MANSPEPPAGATDPPAAPSRSADPRRPEPALLSGLVDTLVTSYLEDDRLQHIDAIFLPSRNRCIEVVELLRKLTFPGFFDDCRLTTANAAAHAARLLERVDALLYEQIRQTERYLLHRAGGAAAGDDCPECDARAREKTDAFLGAIPEVRRKLTLDVQAAFDGDPAATSTDEAIFCYPGVDAIFIHRYAHELYKLHLNLLARIFSEYAHNETGIEIHPGAEIGESFFIDHGTGIVIGETVNIGRGVKVYQGVTLGALSTKGGQDWRGMKRHPTLEDDVTIYGNAIILGGQTVIGRGATINGSLFVTQSVPAGHTASVDQLEVKLRPPRPRKPRPARLRDAAPPPQATPPQAPG
ncbi:MAG: serine acetyltransferase [Planctomycetota bacterium]